ncbi:MAG: NUDIX domain-containing protein [Patescibacteria group bacterium]
MSEQRTKVGVGVMILRGGKILLGLRNEDAEKASSELHGEGTWTMPGGKMDFQEKLVDLCFRETKEETGIEIAKDKLKLISIQENITADKHFITLGFLSENFSGEPKVCEPDEIIEWRWFPIADIPENIFPPSKQVLDHYLNHKIF